MFIDI